MLTNIYSKVITFEFGELLTRETSIFAQCDRTIMQGLRSTDRRIVKELADDGMGAIEIVSW